MVTGLRIPVGVNASGGTALVSGDECKRQLILTSLSSSESANAFQQEINLGQEMIFQQDSPSFRAGIMRKLIKIFTEFEKQKLFRLMRETIAWSAGEEGELVLEFSYIDIESDATRFFRKSFTTGA
jgi:hypothetical protein